MKKLWRKTTSLAVLLAACCSTSGILSQESAPSADSETRTVVLSSAPENTSPEDNVQLTAMLFQPPPELAAQPSAQPVPRRTTSSRQSGIRLASVPNMFGDVGTATLRASFVDSIGGSQNAAFADIPLPGGGGQTAKLAENDRPIPTDRVFFSYNHFQNIFTVRQQVFAPTPAIFTRQLPLDRYTIGAEKTFFDGWSSIEVRMPFQGFSDVTLADTSVNGGNIGNLAAVLKTLLYFDDDLAIGAGMAIDTPTGSDVITTFGNSSLRFNNDATHLLPYIGFLYSPGDPRWGWGDSLFITGIAQASVATNGNTVQVLGQGGPVGEIGKLNDQTLMFFDIGVGYWLYRDPDAPRWTGVALLGEVHYTTTVQDADRIATPIGLGSLVDIGNSVNRFDVVNGTIGLQFLMFDASSFRVAGVFPLGSREDQRMFDSEVQFQFNRRF
jgi:hypothetical protein